MNFDGPQKDLVHCIACGHDMLLTQFRQMTPEPTFLYVDFCIDCERQHGTRTLYLDPRYTHKVYRPARDFALNYDPMSKKIDRKALAAGNPVNIAKREAKEEIAAAEEMRELAARELMRKRLLFYVVKFNPEYKAGWVHKDLARRLEQFVEDVNAKKSPRLMVFMPPRHGKSTLASQELPSWILGRFPTWEIISSSYAITLPIGFSRRIRDRLEDPIYQALFPDTRLRSDARGVEEWQTTQRGRYRAVGVEGGITGTGAHVLIIDDPIKDYQEAQSETIRETAYNWYTTTARTRMSPGGGVLLIQTRWHDADLSGRLLTDKQLLLESGVPIEEVDDWQVVSYPAIAEDDEWLFPDRSIQVAPAEVPEGAKQLRAKDDALHPDRYSTNELRRIRNTMPSAQWNALYQQNPVPDTGEFFVKDNMRYCTQLPGSEEEFRFFSAWDLAIGEKAQNDWTVGTVGALHYTGNLYIVDMFRARVNAPAIIAAAMAMAKKWPGLQVLGMEYGQIYKTMAPLLKDAMAREKVHFSLTEDLKPVTDKLLRARPLQQMMQMGQVIFPHGQPWVGRIEHEMLRFPSGQHDDIVDSLAWLVRMAMVIKPPRVAKAKKGRPPESWKKGLAALTSSGGNFMTA